MAEAVAHLAHLGHRRLAYTAGPIECWSDRERRSRAAKLGADAGLNVEVLDLARPDYAAARDVVSKLLATGVTAAIARDDVVAQGLVAGLAVRGIQEPRDFSVIGCDDVLAATTHPPLTTISAGYAAAGEAAIGLLLRKLSGEQVTEENEQIAIGTHLVVRASAGPVPTVGR